MRVARVTAQAKVNLCLFVGPAAPDGFHSILTIFQRIDLADNIVVRVGGLVRRLDCDGPRLPPGGLGPQERNLAYRAAAAYAEQADWVRGFSIELTKHVPAGGGLGGGSADAGAVLRALDALAPSPLGADALVAIAAGLGSDVAFFTTEASTAIGAGRGEQLELIEPLPPRDVLLAVPDFAIATADAYRWLDADGGGTLPPGRAGHRVIQLEGAESWEGIARTSHNDFERVIEARYPMIRDMRERLGANGASVARLSGSGSTVFGVFDGTAPSPDALGLDALVIPTRTASRVVQVEVLE